MSESMSRVHLASEVCCEIRADSPREGACGTGRGLCLSICPQSHQEIHFCMCRLRQRRHPGCNLLGQVLPASPTHPPRASWSRPAAVLPGSGRGWKQEVGVGIFPPEPKGRYAARLSYYHHLKKSLEGLGAVATSTLAPIFCFLSTTPCQKLLEKQPILAWRGVGEKKGTR